MMNGCKYTAKKKACQYNTLCGPPRAEDRQLCTNGDQPRGVMGTTPMAFGILLLTNVSEPPALCLSETVKNSTTVIVDFHKITVSTPRTLQEGSHFCYATSGNASRRAMTCLRIYRKPIR
jgi:hypothetical protein